MLWGDTRAPRGPVPAGLTPGARGGVSGAGTGSSGAEAGGLCVRGGRVGPVSQVQLRATAGASLSGRERTALPVGGIRRQSVQVGFWSRPPAAWQTEHASQGSPDFPPYWDLSQRVGEKVVGSVGATGPWDARGWAETGCGPRAESPVQEVGAVLDRNGPAPKHMVYGPNGKAPECHQ